MSDVEEFDPYAGNCLTEGLGRILSRHDALKDLTFCPPIPIGVAAIPRHVRLHALMGLRDLHLPSLEEARLQQTVDLLIRQGYRYRDPVAPNTWSVIGGEPVKHKTVRSPAMAALVVGHSGVGKTEAILRCFAMYPPVIKHNTFPNIAGSHLQVVSQSVDVPATGKSSDLAASLMARWEETMAVHAPDAVGRFTAALSKGKRDGAKMLDEWRQVAIGHFLGALHLDEVQNFFRLASLDKRRKKPGGNVELLVVEDQCLKWILALTNTWGMPVLLSGTPDGVGALTKRLANVQRFVTGGYHPFTRFESIEDPLYFGKTGFINMFGRYQYVSQPIAITRQVAELILELTAGIQRLIVALWIAAHRVAYERVEDDLRVEDIVRAAKTYLAPVQPAVEALRSKDPLLMSRYEDLIRCEDNFWAGFWNAMSSC